MAVLCSVWVPGDKRKSNFERSQTLKNLMVVLVEACGCG